MTTRRILVATAAALVGIGTAFAQDVLIRGARAPHGGRRRHPRKFRRAGSRRTHRRGWQQHCRARGHYRRGREWPAGDARSFRRAHADRARRGQPGGDTYDAELRLGAPAWQHMWRPEFDVTPAFNSRSIVLPVARIEGVTWSMLAPYAADSLVVGQGSAVTLDGRFDAAFNGSRSLFVNWGSAAHDAPGGSRAAQYMLFDQAIREVREPATASSGALSCPKAAPC